MAEHNSSLFDDVELTCRDFIRLLGDYYDDELPLELRERFEAHRQCCAKCREFEAGYNFTIELARELRQQSIPPAAHNRLRQALNRRLGINLPLEGDK